LQDKATEKFKNKYIVYELLIGILMTTPETFNILSNGNYQLTITRATNLEYFCQDIIWPSIELPPVLQGTPFQDMRIQGDHMQVSPLTVSFLVDEDMNNYFYLLEWMIEAGFPDNYSQYQHAATNNDLYSDGTVIVYNNTKNVIRSVNFTRMFPIKLSAPKFTPTNTAVRYVICDVTFYFQSMKIDKTGSIDKVVL
jgi:hypothetical protein